MQRFYQALFCISWERWQNGRNISNRNEFRTVGKTFKKICRRELCWRFVLERKNMEKTHKIDVVSIRLVEEPPLYSSKN